MNKFDYDATYFNPKDVLECGQIFRFKEYREGYLVFSADKACYVHTDGVRTFVESDYPDYFYEFFDLGRDYARVIAEIDKFNVPVITAACQKARGLRLLNQDAEETIFSFIISQNNNIPRIKGIIERMCSGLGEPREFDGVHYNAFPTAAAIAAKNAEYYKSLGAGYRDSFLCETAKRISSEGIAHLRSLNAADLKKELLTYRGIGPKVADCICLFGFKRAASFPVDTWIEKIYHEDFGGQLKDRNKINAYFTSLFGEYSGYVQQYLFYSKRANL